MPCLHFQRLTSVLTSKAEPVDIVWFAPLERYGTDYSLQGNAYT